MGTRFKQRDFVSYLVFFLMLPICFPNHVGAGGDTRSSKPTPYPLHRNITSTVFWVGETLTGRHGPSNNTMSAWDKHWLAHYGGVDDPLRRRGYHPVGFTPRENPFYVALPYNDFNKRRKPSAFKYIYWAGEKSQWSPRESMCKNRWVMIIKKGNVVYAQWEDVGPFEDDDVRYVFGSKRPRNRHHHHAGIDVSPAVRDYLGLSDIDTVDWRFVPAQEVPNGPWKEIVTTSQTCW